VRLPFAPLAPVRLIASGASDAAFELGALRLRRVGGT
jgi:hypothetical protein